MRVIRAGIPALIGAVLLAAGALPILSGLGSGGREGLVSVIRGGFIPIAVGAGLLLIAVALARQSRLGYLLGLLAAALFTVAGLAVLVLEASLLSSEEFGGIYAVPLLLIGGGWSLIWIAYGVGLWRARSTFVPTWQPGDRLLAGAVVALVVGAVGVNFALNALEASAIAADEGNRLQAAGLIEGTTLAIQVKDATITQETVGATTGLIVEHLKLTLAINTAAEYALFERPALCLTDLATYQDPAYKSGNVCWGGEGVPISVMDDSGTPGLPKGATDIDVDLSRSGSPCPFTAGIWNAELTLSPRTDAGAQENYTIRTTFQVGPAVAETAPPPSGTMEAGSACMASLVSK